MSINDIFKVNGDGDEEKRAWMDMCKLVVDMEECLENIMSHIVERTARVTEEHELTEVSQNVRALCKPTLIEMEKVNTKINSGYSLTDKNKKKPSSKPPI